MACAEFIGSQVGKGWRLVDTIYEDRGYSGSHMRRAGFRSLLNDIKQLIDRVAVHADRLHIDFSLDGLMDLILELLADQPDLVRTYRQLYSSARSHGL